MIIKYYLLKKMKILNSEYYKFFFIKFNKNKFKYLT